LSLINSAGGGDSVVNIQDVTGNLAILNMANSLGGNSVISMGVLGGKKVNLVAPSVDQGQLQVQSNATGTSYLTVDISNNSVVVGDIGSVGTVNLNCSTVIKDSVGGANGLGLSPTSATVSVISQTIASGGSLYLGSSLAQSSTLGVIDSGANAGSVFVAGRGAAGGILMGGGALGNQGTIACNGSAGILQLGSNNTANFDAIQISDSPQNQTVIKNLIPPTISIGNNVLFPGPFLTGGNYIPAPTGLAQGMYILILNGIVSSYFAQGSGIAYWTGTIWGSGGAFVTPSNGTGVLAVQPDPTTPGELFYNNSSGASIAASLICIPLFVGSIPNL